MISINSVVRLSDTGIMASTNSKPSAILGALRQYPNGVNIETLTRLTGIRHEHLINHLKQYENDGLLETTNQSNMPINPVNVIGSYQNVASKPKIFTKASATEHSSTREHSDIDSQFESQKFVF